MDNISNEKKELTNGLYLMMSFKSIHTAGDRCQVVFEAVIDVDIKEAYFDDELLNGFNSTDVRHLLGSRTSYYYSKTRNFVAEDEKDSILEDMKQQFLESSVTYLSSPLFPLKLIKRNYLAVEKKEMIRAKREVSLK